MKKALSLCIIIITIAVLINSAMAQQETRGFDNPYECATTLFYALKNNDPHSIEDCYAITEMARSFNFRKFAERLDAVTPLYQWMPGNTEMSITYNEASIRSSLYRRLIFSSMLLVDREFGEKVTSGRTYAPLDDNAYKLISFIEAPSSYDGLSFLSLKEIVTPNAFPRIAEKYYSELNIKNRKKQTSYWAVEDDLELAIIAEVNIRSNFSTIIIPVRLVQINGRWLADPLSSNLSSLMAIDNNHIFIPESEIH